MVLNLTSLSSPECQITNKVISKTQAKSLEMINIRGRKLNFPIIAYPIRNQQFQPTSKGKRNKVLHDSIRLPVEESLNSTPLRKELISPRSIRVRYSTVSPPTSQRRRARTCTKLSNRDAIRAIARMLYHNQKNARYFERHLLT